MTSRTPRTGRARGGAEAQLRSFIAKFDRPHQSLIRAVRKALRGRFPTAYELVYDNYNFFVIGYSPSARPSESILSIAAGASGVNLFFLHGAKLPDPKRILQGSGSQTRFIRLPSVDILDRAEVAALVAAAAARARTPFRATGKPGLVIRSVSAKQRPRRKDSPRKKA